MAVYMFSYDLKNRTAEDHASDSAKIKEAIETMGSWCKYLTTTYLIESYQTQEDIAETLQRYMKPCDRMILSKIEPPISGWLGDDQWDWIQKNIY